MWIVKFHADGGQACAPGQRVFTKQEDAETFADRMRNEPGHTCTNSVRMFWDVGPYVNFGVIYPGIANFGRREHEKR